METSTETPRPQDSRHGQAINTFRVIWTAHRVIAGVGLGPSQLELKALNRRGSESATKHAQRLLLCYLRITIGSGI